MRQFRGIMAFSVMAIGILWSAFQLWTGGIEIMVAMRQRAIHLMFTEILVFLLFPMRKAWVKSRWALGVDLGLAVLSVVTGLYVFIEYEILTQRIGISTTADLVLGCVAVILLLESTRRVIGAVMPGIAVVFLLYAYFGQYAPDLFAHRGYDIDRIFSQMYLTTEGIYGLILGVSATFIYLFVLFGGFLNVSGGGKFFIDIAYGLFGRVRGGPAKVAVVASGLFGTISGSAAANVVGTGTFTIPLMKSIGYKAHFAGAVEAVASSGGQLMPPVMGAAAFIMAEILQISYFQVCIYAVFPALLYYFCCFMMVDLEAAKTGLKGVSREMLPKVGKILQEQGLLILPVPVLIYFLAIMQTTPMKAAFWAIITTFGLLVFQAILAKFRKLGNQLPTSRKLFQTGVVIMRQTGEAMHEGATGSLIVATACATAGIIVGVTNLTGLGLKLSAILIDLSGGSLLALLVLTMIASLILGMGLPTTACYILLAVLAAPALIKLGVLPIGAHLFVFYFGIISAITPPVAGAAYAASAIAKAGPMRIGFTACRLGIAAFILPYLWIYGPALLLIGDPFEVIWAVITSTIGIAACAAGVQGYVFRPTRILERVTLLIAAMLLIKPGWITDVIGLGLLVPVLLNQGLLGKLAGLRKRHPSAAGR
ncbi:MAG: TRAP transporter permease [Deltaproteobacteria bacterium]|nr:TRAP transporter permease [Deltaproteobacteria bacterium]